MRRLLPWLLLSLCACGEPRAADGLLVFAASSLRDACEKIEASYTQAPITFVFGASNDLARQIQASGRGALFLCADERQVSGLSSIATTRLLSNRLVVVSSQADRTWPPTQELRRLALAQPEAVPAGVYARGWLESIGLWQELASRVVPCTDVRAALATVESGAAELGIVYATDAALSKRAHVIHRVPLGEGPPIVYPMVLLDGGDARARDLYDWLRGDEAQVIFERLGFLVPQED